MELLLAAAPAFLASLVEAVEALTIVLAVGVTRQWRGALYGVAAALVTLTVLVAIFGTAIVLFVPIDVLRVVIGTLLLIYGLQWTVKAILRGSGAKALHDEERIYAEQVGRLREEPPVPATGLDGISFTVAFKGVLLEGPGSGLHRDHVRRERRPARPGRVRCRARRRARGRRSASRSTGRSRACRRTRSSSSSA